MRQTPFDLVFAGIAAERFPAIADTADRDEFVLLEPVGRLLREIVPEEAEADAIEGHALLLHHAHRHWVGGGWVYRIGEQALARALHGVSVTWDPPHPALYLQLPELRIWGTPTREGPAEPLDGIFVARMSRPGGLSVLGIYGMRPDRPGFSAMGIEGSADPDEGAPEEIEISAPRVDGSAPFGPRLAGGSAAGLYSLANPGELLLLACRILAVIPPDAPSTAGSGMERYIHVD
jgi:hypothetical protein